MLRLQIVAAGSGWTIGRIGARICGFIALLRGATAPWAPRNAASKLIRGAMRLLPAEFRIVTALESLRFRWRGSAFPLVAIDRAVRDYEVAGR